MATFPVFIDVGQRPPLVVGGGDEALIKARLLLKRADVVTFAADALVDDIHALTQSGQAEIIPALPTRGDIQRRPLVISATGDDAEDRRVSEIARSLGVPVNVPDRMELCTFYLASIVDRYPVTVAIGSEGTAPVLATGIRKDIEQDLPPRLGHLAQAADDFRPAVANTLPPGAARRDFWRDVFTGEAGQAILNGEDDCGREMIARTLTEIRAQTATPSQVRPDSASSTPHPAGRVLLVGAGPGDPELMTLKAVRALKEADVILHDGLMGDGVLDYARREAKIISVAKAKGRHSKTQAEINALILAYARDGQTVVRLKGGDPFVFGRGGEEVDLLRASGIKVEVVPGITSATAAAASLQVPLTHRDLGRSVTFLSGHAAGDGTPDFEQMDFTALANRHATLAVYMGRTTSRQLAVKLIDSGWAPTTPLIAVARASQIGERRVRLTLKELQHDGIALDGPVLMIIGEVASLDVAGVIETAATQLPTPQPLEAAHA